MGQSPAGHHVTVSCLECWSVGRFHKRHRFASPLCSGLCARTTHAWDNVCFLLAYPVLRHHVSCQFWLTDSWPSSRHVLSLLLVSWRQNVSLHVTFLDVHAAERSWHQRTFAFRLSASEGPSPHPRLSRLSVLVFVNRWCCWVLIDPAVSHQVFFWEGGWVGVAA